MDNNEPDEASVVGGSKLDHLYTYNFNNQAGKYFNLVTEENGVISIEYNQPYPTRNRIKLAVTFIKNKNDIEKVTFKKFKELKRGWVEEGEQISLSYFTFDKLRYFLELLTQLDLATFNERRVDLLQIDVGTTVEPEIWMKIKTLLLQKEGQKIVEELLNHDYLTSKDIVNIGYRKKQLSIFDRLLHEDGFLANYSTEEHLTDSKPEKVWQHFFQTNDWIFGFGLDYRYLSILQREAHVGPTDTSGKQSPVGDYLLGYTNFTVLVEMKRPDTQLFTARRGSANSWKLSVDLMSAVSQILEQKASWQVQGVINTNKNYTDSGKLIRQNTIDPRCILIIGSSSQFNGNDQEKAMKERTFELFRRDSRNIEILTYDELYDRAEFIVGQNRRR